MHNYSAKMPMLASRRLCYLELVHTDTPLPTGSPQKLQVCVMNLSMLQGLVQRAAPAVLTTAMFGLVVAFAAVGVVGVGA